ncbi:homeodomain-like protein [Tanacetum coccineum]
MIIGLIVFKWRDASGNLLWFSIKCVWEVLRPRGIEVPWYNIVWFSHCIPRHAFHLWLVLRRSLKTQDKLRTWDVGPTTDLTLLRCSLCDARMDSHEHLFFECAFSSKVWVYVRNLADMDGGSPTFHDIISFLQPMGKSRTAKCIFETQKGCYVSERWVLEDGVLQGKWTWRRQPSGRAKGDLFLLLSLINMIVLDSTQDDKWRWILNDSGIFGGTTDATNARQSKRELHGIFSTTSFTHQGTIFLNVDQLENHLDKEEFQENGSMAAFRVLKTQFQPFINSRFFLDYDGEMTSKYFLEYTRIEVQQFYDTLIQHMEYVKKSIDERALHKRDGTDDDAYIKPVYDDEPMAEVQTTAKINVLANEQQHVVQPI